MIPSPRVLRTTCRGGVLAWRSSSCSPFVQPADGESPTLSVSLFPPCIPPVVASVPTLDVSAASFRSRGRWGRFVPPTLDQCFCSSSSAVFCRVWTFVHDRVSYGFVCSASSSCGAPEPLPAASVEATLSHLQVSVRPIYPLLAILSIPPGDWEVVCLGNKMLSLVLVPLLSSILTFGGLLGFNF